VPVVLDVTHSVQLPGSAGDASGGQAELIEPLARAGIGASGRGDLKFHSIHVPC